jgi:hypothetical protein
MHSGKPNMYNLKFAVLIIAIIASQSSLFELRAEHNCSVLDQDSVSTTYYADYSDLLALRIYTNTKWNTLDIIKEDQTLSLRPHSPTSLGAGFNYKDYGLAIAFGLPKSESSNKKYGSTKRLDLQMNMYSPKFGFDGFAQFYKGYYNSNPDDFVEWESETLPQLPSMRVVSLGLNAFYIFNSDKFSYKAAFVRNQVQLKSAGSFTAGVFGHYDAAETDNGFIPTEYPDSISNNFDLKSFNTLAIGVTIGYLYTWVISEHFFINVGVTPGFGNQRIELETLSGQKSVQNAPAAQLAARSALGYDSRFFYIGVTGLITWRNFQYKGYDLDLSTEQIKVFVGKRFDLRKKR